MEYQQVLDEFDSSLEEIMVIKDKEDILNIIIDEGLNFTADDFIALVGNIDETTGEAKLYGLPNDYSGNSDFLEPHEIDPYTEVIPLI